MKGEPDIKADIEAAEDRGETTGLMEPLLIGETSRHRDALTDLALELAQKAAGFRRSLPECLLTSLASLVRAMNGYHSNLIEGHDTHPVDIERALKNDYSKDSRKRDLQLEHKRTLGRSHSGSEWGVSMDWMWTCGFGRGILNLSAWARGVV
jgi:hypothetical protein